MQLGAILSDLADKGRQERLKTLNRTIRYMKYIKLGQANIKINCDGSGVDDHKKHFVNH